MLWWRKRRDSPMVKSMCVFAKELLLVPNTHNHYLQLQGTDTLFWPPQTHKWKKNLKANKNVLWWFE